MSARKASGLYQRPRRPVLQQRHAIAGDAWPGSNPNVHLGHRVGCVHAARYALGEIQVQEGQDHGSNVRSRCMGATRAKAEVRACSEAMRTRRNIIDQDEVDGDLLCGKKSATFVC
jgi:hypothetical protein